METPRVDFSKLDPANWEEEGQKDPLWRAINGKFKDTPTILDLTFLSRMTDTFLFVRDLLDVLHAAGPQIVRRKMLGFPDMLREFASVLPDDGQTYLTKVMEHQFEKKIERYEPWLLNQGLVMLCTALDVFFEHVVDVIYRKKINLLYRPQESRGIHLRDVVRLGSVDAVVADFRAEEVRRFGFLDTTKRLEYLSNRCQFDTRSLFDLTTFKQEVQEQLKDFNSKKLHTIYDDRHSVVHNDKLPISRVEELEAIKDFFDKLIWNTAREAERKHDLLLETSRTLMIVRLYDVAQKKSQAESS